MNEHPFHMTCKEGQFDAVEIMVIRLLVSIWMFDKSMEWLYGY